MGPVFPLPGAQRRSIPGRSGARRLRDMAASPFPPECCLLISWSCFSRTSFCSWSLSLAGGRDREGR